MRSKVLVFLLAIGIVALHPVAADASASCDKAFADIVQSVGKAVVQVTAVAVDPFKLHDRIEYSTGSGFVVEPGDLIVTNSHVVYGASELYVRSVGGLRVPAEFAGADPILDLAVLKMPRAFPWLPPLALGDSDAVRIGDEVMAVGNSFGLGQTVTTGVVSGANRVLPLTPMSYLLPFIQTDAAINPGSSGGPLIDRCGKVIGINTVMLRIAENIGFAVPANVARRIVPELVERGRVIRAWHGIYGRMVDPELLRFFNVPLVEGFLVETVEPGSPAEAAGIRGGAVPVIVGAETFILGGDIITKVNGSAIRDIQTVMWLVSRLKVGDTMTVEYVRDGETFTAEAVLPERPILPSDIARNKD
jgi:putative serine protease PepD